MKKSPPSRSALSVPWTMTARVPKFSVHSSVIVCVPL
jgi:hypothetical protein